MKKVFKFVKGKRDDKKDSGGITPSPSGDLISPAQTPEDERFLGLDSSSGYIVDFCGKDKTLTKLHKAAWQGNLDKLKSALKKIEIDAVDRHNRSALHFAVVQGHPNIVWFLLGNNAKMTICDHEGRTPLLKAVECAHKECMTLLLERGADVNATDYCGSSGLHIAAKQGSLDIVSALLNRNADLEISNNSGEYPLHIATRSQNKDLVELLLRCGASVNVSDRENRTPLMLAAKTGNLLLAQLFFEYGAQLTVVDSNGWTAEDYALLGGHQNVATELKVLMKKEGLKSDCSVLATHKEEDESDLARSAENSGTWNDSQPSEGNEPKDSITKKLNDFFKNYSEDGMDKEEEVQEAQEAQDSPGSGVVPPPCQPPRSWEIIQAGMIDDNAEGAEPKRRSIMALGTLHSRRESFTEVLNNSAQGDAPRYTLSLNRRKDAKKGETYAKQRLSFNDESMHSWIKEDSPADKPESEETESKVASHVNGQAHKKSKTSSESEWDSDFCLSLDTSGVKLKSGGSAESGSLDKKDRLLRRTMPVDVNSTDSESMESPHGISRKTKHKIEGTLGRPDTLQGTEEIWVANPCIQYKTERALVEKEVAFPPPPTALELGADIAKSMSYIKGVSIDHPPGSVSERNVWKNAYESQCHSLDCLDEKDKESLSLLDKLSEKAAPSKRHHRHQSVSALKWRSEELPQCQRPVDRLVDVNRRINEQLECYDQALRELAESPYTKKQDAILSTLTSTSSRAHNYYSLPASKFKGSFSVSNQSRASYGSLERERNLPPNTTNTTHFISNNNYYYDKPPFGSKPFIEMGSGPVSLPFFVNDNHDRGYMPKKSDVENNERLGAEERVRTPKTKDLKTSHSHPKAIHEEKMEEGSKQQTVKPCTLPLKQRGDAMECDNTESPVSDDLSGSGSDKGDKRSRRHMLLAMRDVKHAVQVTASFKSSLDEQILSPLTKTSDNFELDDRKLSPKATSSSSEGASPGDEYPFFKTDYFGRQETVVEKADYRRRSSSSGTGDEPTLWLQDAADAAEAAKQTPKQPAFNSGDARQRKSVKHERMSSFSPLGAVYREVQAEQKKRRKKAASNSSTEESTNTSPASDKEDVPQTLETHPLERLQSSSSEGLSFHKEANDDSVSSRYKADDRERSPDVSFSSGPIEPLGMGKDSASEDDSTHQESHHEWLQRHLRTATNEKSKLEELAVQLSEKAERLQYELADAKEASKSRDEIIGLLQDQLSRMEDAYTKSLEESVRSRLQLTTHEQEILHLKELCFQYEEEKERAASDTCEDDNSELRSHLKLLKDEKDKMKRAILRLEQEKGCLERKLQEVTAAGLLEECEKWKERCEDLEQSVRENDKKQSLFEKYLKTIRQEHSQQEEVLKERNSDLEKKILEIREKNADLESRIQNLTREMETSKHRAEKNEDLNKSILDLGKKNTELEMQLKTLQKELTEKEETRKKNDEMDLKALVDQLNNERDSLAQRRNPQGGEEASSKNNRKGSNDSLKKELFLLREQFNKHESDTLLKENANLKQEVKDLKEKLTNTFPQQHDVPNFKVEFTDIFDENTNIKSQITDLRSQVQSLNEALDNERLQLQECQTKNVRLEQHISKLATDTDTDARQNLITGRVSKKREVGKKDELAWSNLYGIKQVGKEKEDKTDSELSGSLDLERVKELVELKQQLVQLQHRMVDEKTLRFTLENRIAEVTLDLKDKQKLEIEIDSLKRRMGKEVSKERAPEVEEEEGDGVTGAADSVGEEYRARCEVLARERERAKALRQKFTRRGCSFDTLRTVTTGTAGSHQRFHSFPRSSSQALTVRFSTGHQLDEELKTKLDQELDKSVRRYSSGEQMK